MARLKQSSAILLSTKTPVAISEGWTLSRLASECHCGRDAARSSLERYRDVIQRQTEEELNQRCFSLAEEAQKARNFALSLLERHAMLVHRAVVQLEKADEVDINDLARLTKLNLEHFKLVEMVTGLDVAKAVAVKCFKKEDKKAASWDGVQALAVLMERHEAEAWDG